MKPRNFTQSRLNSAFVVLTSFFAFGCSLAYAKALPPSDAGKALFTYAGKSYKADDLSPAMQQAIYDADKLRYDNLLRVAQSVILDEHIEEKVKASGKPKAAVVDEVFNISVSQSEAKAFYDANKARLGGRDFASIEKDLMTYLKGQSQEKSRERVVAGLQSKGKFNFAMKEPTAPRFAINSAGFPSKGKEKAKVTVVEFADYTCPHCQLASASLKKVAEEYKDRVKFVFMDFPLRDEGPSMTVARGAVCADEQAKFWEFHYAAFERQASLNTESPLEIAKELKLNIEKFQTCFAASATTEKVKKARAEGIRLGIEGTPAIYIDGRKHAGYEEESLKAELKKRL